MLEFSSVIAVKECFPLLLLKITKFSPRGRYKNVITQQEGDKRTNKRVTLDKMIQVKWRFFTFLNMTFFHNGLL